MTASNALEMMSLSQHFIGGLRTTMTKLNDASLQVRIQAGELKISRRLSTVFQGQMLVDSPPLD
jgi:hypothetical protein